jgi:hypothetical protein
MKALLIEGVGWANHPATRMWQGYERALYSYQCAVVREWLKRGYRDTCLDKTRLVLLEHRPDIFDVRPIKPAWFGDPAFHKAHKSNLVRKNPEYYRQFFPNVRDDLEYIWPTQKESNH